MTTITCKKELTTWTVRVNGHFITDFAGFHGEVKARRLAMKLAEALNVVVTG